MMKCFWTPEDHEVDGSMKAFGSLLEPIFVEELRPERAAIWEDTYIAKHLGYSHLCSRVAHEHGLRRVERVVVRTPVGVHVVFYFDVTIQLDEGTKLFEKTKADLAAGRRVSGPLRRWVERLEREKRKLGAEGGRDG